MASLMAEREDMKIYISGKITGDENFLEKFEKAEAELREKRPFCEIINPARTNATLPKSTTWEQYMNMCYSMLDMCDAIYLLDDWGDSRGACIELGYSIAMDKIILKESEV